MKQCDIPPVIRRNVALTENLLFYIMGIQEMKLVPKFLPYFFQSKYLEAASTVTNKAMSYALIVLLLSEEQGGFLPSPTRN
jgi:hypothetical protein